MFKPYLCLGFLSLLTFHCSEASVIANFRNYLNPKRQCASLNSLKNLFKESQQLNCIQGKNCSDASLKKEKGRCAQIRTLLCNPYCGAAQIKASNKDSLSRELWRESIEDLYQAYFGHPSGALNEDILFTPCSGEDCQKGAFPQFKEFQTNNPNKHRAFVLSVDGGGIKGLIPAKILITIEKEVRKKLSAKGWPAADTFQLSDVFTLASGTSTGGLIALYLNAKDPKTGAYYTTESLADLYKTLGKQVFHSGSRLRNLRGAGGVLTAKYSAKPLEALLREKLGNQKLAYTKNYVLVTSVKITGKKQVFFPFSTNNAIQSVQGATEDKNLNFFLWQAARATSAAPTFFKPFTIQLLDNQKLTFIDGGVGTNNPAVVALDELNKIMNTHNLQLNSNFEIVLLSLSTGEENFNDDIATPEFSGAFSGGAFQVLSPTMGALLNIPSAAATKDVASALKQAGGKFIRIEPQLKVDIPMDVATDKALAKLNEKAGETIIKQRREIEEIASLIAESVLATSSSRIAPSRSHRESPSRKSSLPTIKQVSPLPRRRTGSSTPVATDQLQGEAKDCLLKAQKVCRNLMGTASHAKAAIIAGVDPNNQVDRERFVRLYTFKNNNSGTNLSALAQKKDRKGQIVCVLSTKRNRGKNQAVIERSNEVCKIDGITN